jgi:hypothetical protein
MLVSMPEVMLEGKPVSVLQVMLAPSAQEEGDQSISWQHVPHDDGLSALPRVGMVLRRAPDPADGPRTRRRVGSECGGAGVPCEEPGCAFRSLPTDAEVAAAERG